MKTAMSRENFFSGFQIEKLESIYRKMMISPYETAITDRFGGFFFVVHPEALFATHSNEVPSCSIVRCAVHLVLLSRGGSRASEGNIGGFEKRMGRIPSRLPSHVRLSFPFFHEHE